MPHRFQKIDWKKTLDSIPKDVADLLQKGFDEQNVIASDQMYHSYHFEMYRL